MRCFDLTTFKNIINIYTHFELTIWQTYQNQRDLGSKIPFCVAAFKRLQLWYYQAIAVFTSRSWMERVNARLRRLDAVTIQPNNSQLKRSPQGEIKQLHAGNGLIFCPLFLALFYEVVVTSNSLKSPLKCGRKSALVWQVGCAGLRPTLALRSQVPLARKSALCCFSCNETALTFHFNAIEPRKSRNLE